MTRFMMSLEFFRTLIHSKRIECTIPISGVGYIDMDSVYKKLQVAHKEYCDQWIANSAKGIAAPDIGIYTRIIDELYQQFLDEGRLLCNVNTSVLYETNTVYAFFIMATDKGLYLTTDGIEVITDSYVRAFNRIIKIVNTDMDNKAMI